jgi:transposase
MAYRCGDRHQLDLLPESIEDYVAPEDPVRAYDAFAEALDFGELGIELDPCKLGNASYDPRAMLKLLVYGYSYGVRSSRKLERECHHNLAFLWLMAGLKPDHKTIAEFRRKNKAALKQVLRHCARLCIKLDLIAGNVLFVDGTKIRANASRYRSHDRAWYEKHLADLDRRIEPLPRDCEAIDRRERQMGSYVAMDRELAKAQSLKDRIRKAMETFKSTERKVLNQSDPDCAIMRSIQGSHAAYNVQSVADDVHGLPVHADAVEDTSDVNQFARQIEAANELLETPCEAACADAGYADTEEPGKIDGQGITVIVPSQRQALKKPEGPFSKSRFAYDKEQDVYRCPEGHRLPYQWTDKSTGKRHYQIADGEICRQCRHYGDCTRARKGRQIIRLPNEEIKLKLEALYEEAASQAIYTRRKTRVEHPFGHIKRNLKVDAFLLRGLEGVRAETSLLATCFNMARMITIPGVGGLIEKLGVLMRPCPVAA